MKVSPLLIVIGLTWLTAGSPLQAQDAATSKVSAVGARVFLGADDCALCHLTGLPKTNDPKATGLKALGFGMSNDKWVLLDELQTWAESDKHAQGFTSLLETNERAKQMGRLLGVAEIHRDKRCLACHTGFPLSAMGDDPHLMSAELVADRRVSRGISCEGCHGSSGDSVADGAELVGWNMPHRSKKTWRFLSADEKRAKYGFVNVRTPSARTRMCLSCHLGNVEEGKIVTHEMYAAGHPPLPGFELETFASQMPKHWRDFPAKAEKARSEYLDQNAKADDVYGHDSFRPGNLHSTRNALVAALVSYCENLKLTAALADDAAKSPIAKPDWPELSQFECFACHHDLKDRSWRQQRRLHGAPGRPMLRNWPTPLTKLALKTSGLDPQQLDGRIRVLEKFLSDQPFGNREKWSATAQPMVAWLDEQAVALERKPLPREAGLPLLREIAVVAAGDVWDYDSARQLVWLTQVLRQELLASDDDSLKMRLSLLNADFADVGQLFVLNLIEGKKGIQKLPGEDDSNSREVQESDLTKTLPPIARYDARIFREKFAILADKLK